MSRTSAVPSVCGQLVWCPSDPSQGIGRVVETEHRRVKVWFAHADVERVYTTRAQDCVLSRYSIEPGSQVKDSEGHQVLVRDIVGFDGEGLLRYRLDDGREVSESILLPTVKDSGPVERLAKLQLAHPSGIRARVSGMHLDGWTPSQGHGAVLGARVQWLPHQIDVAARGLDAERTRLLLCDEVGLGKTVEAALIYAGLRAEQRAERVLILTPEALCIQWLGELYRKAHELVVLLDEERIEEAYDHFRDIGPFEAYRRVIAPVSQIATDPKLAAQALEMDWDLVIVDEAHHLRWDANDGGNAAYKLVEGLAQKSKHMLLLTATPMALDPAEHYALLRLLDPERFEEVNAFDDVRTRVDALSALARQLQETADGQAADLDTLASLEELLEDSDDDLSLLERWKAADSEESLELRAQLISRLSERHGLADYVVRNRRGPVGGMPKRVPHLIPLEPTELQDILIDTGESVVLELADDIEDEAKRYDQMGKMLRALWSTPGAILEIARSISPVLDQQLRPHVLEVTQAPKDEKGLPTGDARLRWLVKLIRESMNAKILVFVESAVAVKALKAALDAFLSEPVAVFHRELAPRDQDRQVAWFRDPTGPQVMLSTEAGGEGRNFQFCHKVVLYDVPWRPATIEQRIGRVDRVGQQHNVEVYVPYFRSGYEAAILKVMQKSIGVLDRTVGGIDHALEYVAARLAELVYSGAGVEEWQALYTDTETLVSEATRRIEEAADPILDVASFSRERAEAILNLVPAQLENDMEEFVRGYAEHSKLDVYSKGDNLVGVDGGPSSSGTDNNDTYFATFSRAHALDHEELEFLSFGHPLVETALEWARESGEVSATLAICRGFDHEGAVFVWGFHLDVPESAANLRALFAERAFCIAIDERGERAMALDDLLTDGDLELERMDPAPLKKAVGRWSALVEHNFKCAEGEAEERLSSLRDRAGVALDQRYQTRLERVRRTYARRLFRATEETEELLLAERDAAVQALEEAWSKDRRYLLAVKARPYVGAAVRFLGARSVSG